MQSDYLNDVIFTKEDVEAIKNNIPEKGVTYEQKKKELDDSIKAGVQMPKEIYDKILSRYKKS